MANMIEFLKDNFLHIAPILAAGGLAVAIILDRVRALIFTYPLRNQEAFHEKLRDYIMADRLAEALSLCEQYRSKPVIRVVKEALLRAHQPERLIEDGMALAVGEANQTISNRTPYLATIANVATLLGLFGTILGLIHSFEAVGSASAQQKASLLAAGISTAMNATMMGLGVAIPCMVAYSYLMNKTNRLNAEVEQTAVRMMDMINQRYYEADSEPFGGRNKRSA
jgi:biopolymer transport protein ExbB